MQTSRSPVLGLRCSSMAAIDWHVCPMHGTWPKASSEWWRNKLEANVRRDRDTDARLRDAGWTVIPMWKHEEPAIVADRIEAIVRGSEGGHCSPTAL